jgi:thiosulfate/3-mercaptopyruvate sulfurtransferase
MALSVSHWLITVQELSDRYQNDNIILVDCRFSLADTEYGEKQYFEDHIPGARYFHLDRDMSSQKSHHGGRHPLPDKEVFAQRLRDIGINDDSLVVCYDDQRFAFVSRLWWLLRWLGHESVVVLDGGYQAWKAADLPVTAALPITDGINQPAQGNFTIRKSAVQIVDQNYVSTLHVKTESVLIDSREMPRYRGEQEPIDPVAGHIPGALNKPWVDVTNAEGFALDESLQRQHWNEITKQKEVIVYCGSGVTACVNMLSLAMIGRDDAKLYAGSWSDWCSYIL